MTDRSCKICSAALVVLCILVFGLRQADQSIRQAQCEQRFSNCGYVPASF